MLLLRLYRSKEITARQHLNGKMIPLYEGSRPSFDMPRPMFVYCGNMFTEEEAERKDLLLEEKERRQILQ